ncbi:MAG: hypothetical protein ABWZ79_18985 [Pedobacter agri]
MESICLDNNFELSFEKLPHTVRLIVLKDGEEWVCRKEKLANLFSFIEVDQRFLFKGRLQLCKRDGEIVVQVRNTIIGTFSNQTFTEALNKLK